MRRACTGRILAALALASVLAGCSAAAVIDKLPASVAEPADAPKRPAEAYQYPAVHDMPPPRADQPLTDEQQVQMERDLEKVRDRQEGQNKAGKNAAKPDKKKPAQANQAQTDGGKANP
jgi:hypothetical protein